jgi:hypothetical protein
MALRVGKLPSLISRIPCTVRKDILLDTLRFPKTWESAYVVLEQKQIDFDQAASFVSSNDELASCNATEDIRQVLEELKQASGELPLKEFGVIQFKRNSLVAFELRLSQGSLRSLIDLNEYYDKLQRNDEKRALEVLHWFDFTCVSLFSVAFLFAMMS